MIKEMENRIYTLLEEQDNLDWHGYMWWAHKDEWFAQFSPKFIESVAMDMAREGIIETNGRGGFRRVRKTKSEQRRIKWGLV